MPEDIVSTRLNSTEDDEEIIEQETTDREREFSKITDILLDIRNKFLGGDEMSFDDALAEIQDELTKLTAPGVPSGAGEIAGLPGPPVI